MTTQIVLVPGFWLGDWAWAAVVPPLRDRGHDVVALTLPGRAPEAPGTAVITPQDQADAILAALDHRADRRVLVVHSGAAIPGTMVIDRAPDLVDHVVWVDTAPSRDGAAMNAEFTGAALDLADVWQEEFEQGAMRDLTDDQLETFRARAVPEPGAVVSTAVELRDPRRHDVPGTVVCTSFPASEFRSHAEQGVPFLAALLDYRALEFVDLPTGHWPMWSRPEQLAEIIDAAAARR
ncbi:alpha/beta fold hydrolase [Granulicoccus sp. GXG6511]|uniref:alpha/beta fold hydrolase n=1 Tax=Granulicoccus sp. GXG6511 TaxID=3381351 RepID=UPI003D7C5B6E